MLPFTTQHNRKEYLYRLFYQMFEDGEYDTNHSQTMLSELAMRSDGPKQAREIYEKILRDYEGSLTRNEVRAAWSKTDEDETYEPTLKNIVAHAHEEVPNPTVQTIKHIHLLRGKTDIPPEEEIKRALDEYSK